MRTFLSNQDSLVARSLYANSEDIQAISSENLFGAPDTGITGTGALVESGQTLAAAGDLSFSGAGAATQTGATISAEGTVTAAPISGTAELTQAANTFTASGEVSGESPVQEGGRVIAVRWKPLFAVTAKPSAVSGSASATAKPSTMSATGTNTPKPIIGTATLIALTPGMMARGGFNTDELDAQLATALLNL